jgi:DNA invertase Pin-like site-specific DNA recombinase
LGSHACAPPASRPIRSALQSLGISLRPSTESIDDTSTGKLMEGVLAAFAQFDNDMRSDRTRAGMEGGAGARTLGVPGTERLLERSAIDGQA